jgi:hypothetical protein
VWLAANGHGPDQWREPPDVFEPPAGEDDEEPEMVEA